jgi:hypothetical protein
MVEHPVAHAPPDATVSAPRTWLLRIGWRKLGLVKLGEVGASAVIVANRRSLPELTACHS